MDEGDEVEEEEGDNTVWGDKANTADVTNATMIAKRNRIIISADISFPCRDYSREIIIKVNNIRPPLLGDGRVVWDISQSIRSVFYKNLIPTNLFFFFFFFFLEFYDPI